ncbi:hypothetical protein LA080_008894 [Diaporthe eres]|nr:hypothetical protein LA080_008894 [Diaporthe eres]
MAKEWVKRKTRGREKQRTSMPVSGNWKCPDSTAGSCGQVTSPRVTGPQGSYCMPPWSVLCISWKHQLERPDDFCTNMIDCFAVYMNFLPSSVRCWQSRNRQPVQSNQDPSKSELIF